MRIRINSFPAFIMLILIIFLSVSFIGIRGCVMQKKLCREAVQNNDCNNIILECSGVMNQEYDKMIDACIEIKSRKLK